MAQICPRILSHSQLWFKGGQGVIKKSDKSKFSHTIFKQFVPFDANAQLIYTQYIM